jgi:D-alanyl-D-alanine carboxypeptidase
MHSALPPALLQVLLLSSLAMPDTLPAASLPDTFEAHTVDAYLTAKAEEARLVGLSVAIVKDGELALAKGYGRRSLVDERPVNAETIFAIGSISKQFTCAAVLLLAEEGRLSVHDPVAKWYPDLTRARDITLLDLMNHVSGYPDYYPLDYVERRMQNCCASTPVGNSISSPAQSIPTATPATSCSGAWSRRWPASHSVFFWRNASSDRWA